ncbi:MAG: very short patch repair endonuclease [Rhodospirillales bacterium]|nr:very short patch repair endonuclease [Rhodospirillales bacterium]
MADVVSREVRSRMMSGIRGADTRPEMIIRQGLHRRGFRYRLHSRKLPGKPDLVFPKYTAVIFVNGCFWHGHDCHLFKWPKTRADFWKNKISSNRSRDAANLEILRNRGWRTCIVWECALKGSSPEKLNDVMDQVSWWLNNDAESLDIRGGA